MKHYLTVWPRTDRSNLNSSDARIGDTRGSGVVTTPPYRAAQLLQPSSCGALFKAQRKIEYAPMVITALSFEDFQLRITVKRIRLLVARNQRTACTFSGPSLSSALFPQPAPKGRELLTCFTGGMLGPRKRSTRPTSECGKPYTLNEVCIGKFRDAGTVTLFRQRHAIPQYKIGHERWVREFEDDSRTFADCFWRRIIWKNF